MVNQLVLTHFVDARYRSLSLWLDCLDRRAVDALDGSWSASMDRRKAALLILVDHYRL